MPANTSPIFTEVPNCGRVVLTAANVAKDGTGVVGTIFTAGADGGYIQKIRVRPMGTNVATVARIFLNNGSSNAVADNNILFDEITIAATTNSESAAIAGTEVPMNLALPPGWKVNVALGTAVAGGMAFTGVGGDY
jgi:hypothetical protein